MSLFLFLGFVLIAPEPAGTFCALHFEVADGAGKPLSAQYELVDMVNRIAASGIAKGGRAEICDWDFGVYSLRVVMPGYYGTVIHPVHLIFGQSQLFKVVLNPYVEFEKEVYGCSCYFRVKDENGRQLSGVKITTGGQTLYSYSDDYGRAKVVSPDYKDMVVRFEKVGYETGVEKMNCSTAKQKHTSSPVVLKLMPTR